MAYDSHFCQQVVGDESADWLRLNQSLYAIAFVTQGERDQCRCYILCLESDHAEARTVCSVFTTAAVSQFLKKG